LNLVYKKDSELHVSHFGIEDRIHLLFELGILCCV